MFCNKCGNNIPVGMAFCNRCGAPAGAQQPAQQPVQPAQSPVQPQYSQPQFRPQTPVQPQQPVQQPVQQPAQQQYSQPQFRPQTPVQPAQPQFRQQLPPQFNNRPPVKPPVKSKKPLIIALVASIVLLLSVGVIWAVSSRKSDDDDDDNTTTQYTSVDTTEYTTQTTTDITTNSDEEVTVIIYMIGANLESGDPLANGTYRPAGWATEVLADFLGGSYPGNVNVVVETGGTMAWGNNYGMEGGKTQRFHIENRKYIMDKDLGRTCMAEQETFEDFLKWTKQTYPSDRYILIMYDHGCPGCDITFGVDEVLGHNDHLESYEIVDALNNAGIHLDLTVMSCCLMGTVEFASELSGTSDYLVGSEEVAYTDAFEYDEFVKALCANPSIDTVELAEKYIDRFEYAYIICPNRDYHVALIDTDKAKIAGEKLDEMMKLADEELYAGNANRFFEARSNCGTFGMGDSQEIDIIEFCRLYNLDGSDDVIKAVEDCLLDQRTNMRFANGLSFYCPQYEELFIKYYSFMGRENLKKLKGYDNLNTFIADYYTVYSVYNQGNDLNDLGITSYYNQALADKYQGHAQQYVQNDISLDYIIKNGKYYLDFGDDDNVYTVEKRVGYEFADGRAVALGSDFRTEITADGLVDVSFPETWLSIDGQTVCYVITDQGIGSDGKFYATAVVPFIFPETFDDMPTLYGLIFEWAEDNSGKRNGKLKGYAKINTDTLIIDTVVYDLQPGDNIQFMYALINHDGITLDQDSVKFDPLLQTIHTVPADGLAMSFEPIDNFLRELQSAYPNDRFVGYTYGRVTDIYQMTYTSELIPAN